MDFSRHANFANLVNRIDWFSNQTVNQVRIDELIAAERALTTSELSDLAVSLGFQDTQALNDFGCNTQTDINIIKGSITSVASEDEIVVLNSASRYYPDQTKFSRAESPNYIRNLGITMFTGNCSGIPINEPLGRPEQIKCVENFMIDMISTLPIIGCRDVILNTGNAIFNGASYTTGQFLYELAGCGFGFTPFKQLQVGVTLGTFIYCIISER